jgi:hypothetical protein
VLGSAAGPIRSPPSALKRGGRGWGWGLGLGNVAATAMGHAHCPLTTDHGPLATRLLALVQSGPSALKEVWLDLRFLPC